MIAFVKEDFPTPLLPTKIACLLYKYDFNSSIPIFLYAEVSITGMPISLYTSSIFSSSSVFKSHLFKHTIAGILLFCKIIKYLSINLGCNGGSFAATTITARSTLAATFFVNPTSSNLVLSFFTLDNNDVLFTMFCIIKVSFTLSSNTLSPGKTT